MFIRRGPECSGPFKHGAVQLLQNCRTALFLCFRAIQVGFSCPLSLPTRRETLPLPRMSRKDVRVLPWAHYSCANTMDSGVPRKDGALCRSDRTYEQTFNTSTIQACTARAAHGRTFHSAVMPDNRLGCAPSQVTIWCRRWRCTVHKSANKKAKTSRGGYLAWDIMSFQAESAFSGRGSMDAYRAGRRLETRQERYSSSTRIFSIAAMFSSR